jgi:hypothetical protein
LASDNPLACRLDVRRTASQYTQKSIIHAKVNYYEIATFVALVAVLRKIKVFWNVMLWLFISEESGASNFILQNLKLKDSCKISITFEVVTT